MGYSLDQINLHCVCHQVCVCVCGELDNGENEEIFTVTNHVVRGREYNPEPCSEL